MPVSWVKTGARRGGNQTVTRRSTLMKVRASPVPTSTRASTAPGTVSAVASTACPAAMTSAPAVTMRREPNRSSSTPLGTCIAA